MRLSRRALLLGSASTALVAAGCSTAVITPAQITAWASQIASYVQVVCGFVPDLVAVGNVITALYPPGAVVTNIVTTVGNLICNSPTSHAISPRMASRMAMTLQGAMPINVVHLVATPNGVIAVPGHM